MTTFTAAVYSAAAKRTTVYLAQKVHALPLGDIAAMIAVAKSEGLTVTQAREDAFLADNTSWITVHGNVRPV